MQKTFIASLALAFAGLAASASAQTVVGADIVADTTWGGAANPGPIILELPIFVKDGATLTILPGTIVRGQPRTAAVLAGSTVGTPGALIVTRSGRIIADASSTSPIIMTTAAVDNDDDGIADDDNNDGFDDAWSPGDVFLDDDPANAPLAPLDKAGNANVAKWGGLVINGNAPTNLADDCGTPYGTCTVEGLTIPGFPVSDATYGGDFPHDNSGILRYVSVRHAGDEIGANNELNGISLGGVGDGTVVENVEVYANFDDGVEWFGGTVNAKNLHVAFVGDDVFDTDEGYTGVNQFMFGVMPFFNENDGDPFGSASGDKAGEFDGDNDPNVNVRIQSGLPVGGDDPTCWPLTTNQNYNLTVIGSTPDAGQEFVPASPNSANRGIQMRNGYAGRLLNSIVVNTGTAKGLDLDSSAGCPGFTVDDNVGTGLVAMVSSTLDDTAALGADELAAVSMGDALAPGLGGTANTVNNALFPGLENEDTTFDPTGNAAGKLDSSLKASPIDPRPRFGLIGVGGGVVPQGPELEASATYRGAFLRTAPELWTTGWTVLNIAGLLAD
ncbi:MAG: hypothetical protein ACQGVK_11195 [Myxococcota bacterium]